MKRVVAGALAILSIIVTGMTGCSAQNAIASPFSSSITAYSEALDEGFALGSANAISGYKANPDAGFRTAGSQAESDAAEYIRQQMEAVGLKNVEKKNFDVDIWSFQTGQITYKAPNGTAYFFQAAAYQATLDTEKTKYYELLYASNVTAEGLAALKPEGRFILIDSNPQNLRYIAYQAYLLGAAGVITAGATGTDQLKLEDYQGSSVAPVLLLTAKDAAVLKAAIQSANYVAPVKKKQQATYSSDKSITVGVNVSSRVSSGGISSNVVGTIPGVHPEELLIVTASYDGYFDGFSNSSSAGAMLAMAKAILKSGYQPDKTIVFVAQAADQWGLSENFYDWGQGGYSQIFKLNPEWATKTTAVIHLEAPAFDMGDQYTLRCSYELSSFVGEVIRDMTTEVYPKGLAVTYPRTSKSGDFSYNVAGIPSVGADLSAQSYQAVRNSSKDNNSNYSKDAMMFTLNLYGRLLMRLDQTAVPPLDFAPLLSSLKSSLKAEALNAAGAGTETLNLVIDRALTQISLLKDQIWQSNEDYINDLEKQNATQADKHYNQTRQLYADTLSLYKRSQDLLTRVDINGNLVFPHLRAQENIGHLAEAIAALEKTKVPDALTAVVKIDYNRIALNYDDQVADYFLGLLSKQTRYDYKWSLNLIEQPLDLKNVVNSLQKKSGAKVTLAELSTELTQLQRALTSEKAALSDSVEAMVIGIGILTDQAAGAVGNEQYLQASSTVAASADSSSAAASSNAG